MCVFALGVLVACHQFAVSLLQDGTKHEVAQPESAEETETEQNAFCHACCAEDVELSHGHNPVHVAKVSIAETPPASRRLNQKKQQRSDNQALM